jgi:hypothetical protein
MVTQACNPSQRGEDGEDCDSSLGKKLVKPHLNK